MINYDPKTAFGNMDLITKLEAEVKEKEWLARSRKCPECKGKGEFTCNYGHNHECLDCDGLGRIEKK